MTAPSPNHPLPWRKRQLHSGWWIIEADNSLPVVNLIDDPCSEITADFIVAVANASADLVRELEPQGQSS